MFELIQWASIAMAGLSSIFLSAGLTSYRSG